MEPRLIGLYSPVPQSGKSTAADLLCQHHGYRKEQFARPLKSMAETLLRSLGGAPEELDDYASNRKEEVIPSLGVSFRRLLQTLGTEWGRDMIHSDLWVRAALGRLSGRDKAVIDDVRFPNEAQAILDRGGQVWKIDRPLAAKGRGHRSDGALEEWNFHRLIDNGGDLDWLHEQMKRGLYGT